MTDVTGFDPYEIGETRTPSGSGQKISKMTDVTGLHPYEIGEFKPHPNRGKKIQKGPM